MYIIQPKNIIIFFCILITINGLKAVKSKTFFEWVNHYYMVTKNLFYLLLLCLRHNYSKQIFRIKRNLVFIEKFHDKFLIFSWVNYNTIKKYFFYNIISGFLFHSLYYYLNLNIIFYIYTLNLLFLSCIFIYIGIKLCHRFNKRNVKLLLFLLLWINIFIIMIIIIIIINQFFVFLFTKLTNIKDRLINNFNSNNKKPDFDLFSPDLKKKRRKKTKKILQERSEEMRVKLLTQQKNYKGAKYNIDFTKNKSFSSKRGITKTIYIEPRQNIDLETQFDRIKSELNAYNIQERKFKAWSKGKGKDFTYPDESKQLFKEYSKILKGLRPHLKSMKKKVQKQLKK